jgi:hypothetical protein
MTPAEVEDVFGRPPDVVSPGGGAADRHADAEGATGEEPCEVRYWLGPAHCAGVLFGPDGKATGKRWVEIPPPPWYVRLTDRLGL